jgi:uncharacterized protein YdaU (DUF1376 family)
MTGAPYYPMYHADFDHGTRGMSCEHVGLYLRLLHLMYDAGGPIEDNARRISRHCEMTLQRWAKLRGELLAMGKLSITDDGRLSNGRTIKELLRQRAIIEAKARGGGSHGGGRPAKTTTETREETTQVSPGVFPGNVNGFNETKTGKTQNSELREERAPLPPKGLGPTYVDPGADFDWTKPRIPTPEPVAPLVLTSPEPEPAARRQGLLSVVPPDPKGALFELGTPLLMAISGKPKDRIAAFLGRLVNRERFEPERILAAIHRARDSSVEAADLFRFVTAAAKVAASPSGDPWGAARWAHQQLDAVMSLYGPDKEEGLCLNGMALIPTCDEIAMAVGWPKEQRIRWDEVGVWLRAGYDPACPQTLERIRRIAEQVRARGHDVSGLKLFSAAVFAGPKMDAA